MKKCIQILALAALVALPFAMTSCDDDHWFNGPDHFGGYDDGGYPGGGGYDDGGGNSGNTLYDMAQVLCNTWTGTVQLHEDGQDYQFYANMEFYQNGTNTRSLSGSGIETDYATNESGETESQTLKFTWYIDQTTGDIYITYTESNTQYALDYSATQRGFYLSDTNFYGYMLGVTYPSDYMAFDFTNARNGAKRDAIGVTDTTSTLFGSQTSTPTLKSNLPQRLPKH